MKGIAKKVVAKVKKSLSKETQVRIGNKKLPSPPKIPSSVILEDVPKEVAPPQVIAKGIEALSLIKEKNFPIRVLQKSLPAKKDTNWQNSYPAHEFKAEKIFVKHISQYSSGCVSITYKFGKNSYYATVPNNFLVERLSKEEEDVMRLEEQKFLMENLHLNLSSAVNRTTGTDPEIFVEDENGIVIPAFNFLGSKDKPDKTPVSDQQRGAGGFNMYWDGFQAEFTTIGTGCIAYVLDSIYCGLLGVYQKAIKHNPKARMSAKTVMDIPEQMLKDAKDEHVEFGCMPSFNAYDLAGRKAAGRTVTFRPAGGHIHLGVGAQTNDMYKKMVKALDAILGVACVSLFEGIDDPRRRELYGLPGEYRLPPHGLEYRTLSNAWMFHPVLNMMVFDLARRVVQIGENDLLKNWQTTEPETIECIRTCDVAKAREILARNEKFFKDILFSCYNETSYPPQTRDDTDTLYKCIMAGASSFLRDPKDIVGNWNLDNGKWVFHNRGHIYEEGRHWVASSKVIKEGKKV